MTTLVTQLANLNNSSVCCCEISGSNYIVFAIINEVKHHRHTQHNGRRKEKDHHPRR